MGYALRSASGYFADKFHRHWVFAFLGNAINTLAVPALASIPLGLLFDRFGANVSLIAFLVSAAAAPLVFSAHLALHWWG